jgi:[acyl-carrier-protein] S-malonyltransferase
MNKISENVAFVFPGQGAQAVGMGSRLAVDYPQINSLFQQANEIVGYDLAKICFEGPEDRLNSTEISQPAIFVISAACFSILRDSSSHASDLISYIDMRLQPAFCAGLSLGEYTALYAAGAMGFEEGLRLVKVRGEAMQRAAEENAGGMVSILGLDENQVGELCRTVLEQLKAAGTAAAGCRDAKCCQEEGCEILDPVNFNCPGQIVVSGTKPACQKAVEMAESFGGKAVALRVGGAFHTVMMRSAADRLHAALDKTSFKPLQIPVVANVTGQPYCGHEEIAGKLLDQLVRPVRWQQCVEFLINKGITDFVEIGPGRVLAGLIKKIGRGRKEKITIHNFSA